MKYLLLLFVVSVVISSAAAQSFYGTSDPAEFRTGRDAEFRDKELSPLLAADRAVFKGLEYFPVDPAFRVTARFKRAADEKYFQMPTSSGIAKKFIKYAVMAFMLRGSEYKLSVYKMDPAVLEKFPEYAELLFIPFRDLSNRDTTYGGGRYIDIRTPKGNTATLDFNLSYNPNCAYGSDKYNCPVPPSENSLDAMITAGEKRFVPAGNTPH